MKPIVFFDGHCGLCSWSVDFLIQKDTQRLLMYSPLQGRAAREHNIPAELDTLYVWNEGVLLEKSEAWLWLLKRLGGFWGVLAHILGILPLRFLNFFYDLVARHRYRLFTRRDSCRLPTPEERDRFLD